LGAYCTGPADVVSPTCHKILKIKTLQNLGAYCTGPAGVVSPTCQKILKISRKWVKLKYFSKIKICSSKFFLNITFFRKNIPFIHFVSKLLNIYAKICRKKRRRISFKYSLKPRTC